MNKKGRKNKRCILLPMDHPSWHSGNQVQKVDLFPHCAIRGGGVRDAYCSPIDHPSLKPSKSRGVVTNTRPAMSPGEHKAERPRWEEVAALMSAPGGEEVAAFVSAHSKPPHRLPIGWKFPLGKGHS